MPSGFVLRGGCKRQVQNHFALHIYIYPILRFVDCKVVRKVKHGIHCSRVRTFPIECRAHIVAHRLGQSARRLQNFIYTEKQAFALTGKKQMHFNYFTDPVYFATISGPNGIRRNGFLQNSVEATAKSLHIYCRKCHFHITGLQSVAGTATILRFCCIVGSFHFKPEVLPRVTYEA